MKVFFKVFFNIIVYLSSSSNPSQHSLPYNLWRPPNICHRSVADRCNRGKMNLFHNLICPSWPSVIFVTIVNVLTLPLFVTYLSPNIALKARWIFSIISFLLSCPWVILVNIIDINNTGICHRYLSLNIALKTRQNFLTISNHWSDFLSPIGIVHAWNSAQTLSQCLEFRSIFISWRFGRFQETDSSPFCALMYSGWFYGWGKNAKMGKYLSKISLSALKFQHILGYLPQAREARLLNAVNRVKWNHVSLVINKTRGKLCRSL